MFVLSSGSQTRALGAANTSAAPLTRNLLGLRPRAPAAAAAVADAGALDLGAFDAIQAVPAMLAWNWPAPSLGTSSEGAWLFCDRIPTPGGDTFVPTASSFSQNFATFLQLLDPSRFVAQAALQAALKANVVPGAGQAAPGWTTVAFTETPAQLERAWLVSDLPSLWISRASNIADTQLNVSGAPLMATTRDASGNESSLAFSAELQISAQRWGLITVSAASWYAGDVVSLARSMHGPYLGQLTDQSIFGPSGLLPARVAAFLVALNPSAMTKLPASAQANLAGAGRKLVSVAARGYQFGTAGGQGTKANLGLAPHADGGAVLTAATAFDQAYIMAVCLQLF